MPAANIRDKVSLFQQGWTESSRETIAELLVDECDEDSRNELLAELLEVDIDFRSRRAMEIEPTEYSSVDPLAEELVHSMLFSSSLLIHENCETRAGTCTNGTSAFITPENDSFGPYQLLDCIGEGGMGTVWIAEQKVPVRRRVALKLIRSHIGSAEAIQRFDAERQTIAMMSHPNIAQILDAGTTGAGNPFFVMELVEGTPIDEYCDRKQLGVTERIELTLPVCRALGHAHRKGIVHRDLKPSNILVTECDGKPVPKIIDFGLAKALWQNDGDAKLRSLETEFGSVIGTLQYMSPEQAESGNTDVDTRSDIYSLGVIMFQLLTGTTPLDKERLKSLKLLDALRVIQSEDPGRPASRVRQAGDEDLLCQQRATTPPKLKKLLASDLEWIVLKALEKDRKDRYQNCDALVEDIQRFLNHEKVLARKGSAFYNVRKFVKRNRGLVTSVAALTLLLVTGIVATGIATYWAINERDRANENAGKSTEQRQLAEARLYALRVKSAWKDWQLGSAEAAWQTLNEIDQSPGDWETRFLQREFSGAAHVFNEQALEVVVLQVSPDGRYLASGNFDHTLSVWDLETRERIYRRVLDDCVTDVCFSPDGSLLATSDLSNRIRLFQTCTGEPVNCLGPFSQDLYSVCFDNQGSSLFAGSTGEDTILSLASREVIDTGEPFIRRYNIHDGTPMQTLRGHTAPITSLAISSDGSTVVSGSEDATIRTWKYENDQYSTALELIGHFETVNDIEVSPAGDLIASCSDDKTVRVWDLNSGRLNQSMAGHNESVMGVAWSTDGEQIASVSRDGNAVIRNLKGEELCRFRGHFGIASTVDFAPNGMLFTGSNDSAIRMWDPHSATCTRTRKLHNAPVWCVALSADCRLLASSAEDGEIVLTDPQTMKEIRRIQHNRPGAEWEITDEAAYAVAVSPDGKVVVSGGGSGMTRVWNVQSGQMLAEFGRADSSVWHLCFSNDGRALAVANGKLIDVYDTSTWKSTMQLPGHDGDVACVDFSSDSRRLVSASDDLSVKVWDLETREVLHTFDDHKTPVWRALFSPDDSLIASSTYGGRVTIRDGTTFETIHDFHPHSNQIAGLDFSSDGRRLVTTSDDATIMIHDTGSGITILDLRDRGDGAIVDGTFSPDGNMLISCNTYGNITVRSAIERGNEIKALLPEQTLECSVAQISRLILEYPDRDQLQKELKLASAWSKEFYSYGTLASLGIIQYRLGDSKAAVESLTEAARLESIEYGLDADMIPVIEPYLAMSNLKAGNLQQARRHRQRFMNKRNSSVWQGVPYIEKLWDEVDSTFRESGIE